MKRVPARHHGRTGYACKCVQPSKKNPGFPLYTRDVHRCRKSDCPVIMIDTCRQCSIQVYIGTGWKILAGCSDRKSPGFDICPIYECALCGGAHPSRQAAIECEEEDALAVRRVVYGGPSPKVPTEPKVTP